MKKLSYLLTLLLLVTLMTGCKAFHTLMDSKLKAAQGAPYELIVVCNQQLWASWVIRCVRCCWLRFPI